MPGQNKIITGAYVSGGSFAMNLSEEVNVGTAQEPEMETRYYCTLTGTVMVKYDVGDPQRARKAETARAIDSVTGLNYKLVYWTRDEALIGYLRAGVTVDETSKENEGIGAPAPVTITASIDPE